MCSASWAIISARQSAPCISRKLTNASAASRDMRFRRTRRATPCAWAKGLGQAAKENRPLHVRDVPADYLSIGSSLGTSKASELLVAPASVDGIVHAVVELGFFRPVLAADLDLLARVSESLGVAVRASKDRTRLEELLEETQRQGEELQTQQEELRVNNEELEVQAGRSRNRRRSSNRSRPSSNRPTRSSRSRPSSWSIRRTSWPAHRPSWSSAPPSWSAPISTRASFWPT